MTLVSPVIKFLILVLIERFYVRKYLLKMTKFGDCLKFFETTVSLSRVSMLIGFIQLYLKSPDKVLIKIL